MKFICPCCKAEHYTGYGTQYDCEKCGALLVGKPNGSVEVLKEPKK